MRGRKLGRNVRKKCKKLYSLTKREINGEIDHPKNVKPKIIWRKLGNNVNW